MPPTLLWLAVSLLSANPSAVEQPKVLDPRLTIELFAAEPEIVTPTGIIVEPSGRVLAIESNTHFRPQGYKGPTSDRIRAFEDTDGDGKADRIRTVFEGTSMTMGLAVHPSGALYVATRYEVFRLEKQKDGTYGNRSRIARLETAGNYPHNGLSGFAIDFAGTIFFGLGENLGASYKLIGSDGTTLAGGGEGGNIYECAPDGKGLTRIATGFWNPFHLTLDTFGRLFAVDNDPDSRPPCRLLHIVEGGDYGYRFRNGRRGLHPFTAWNGELPGTLPMVAGTGEAPSGIVAYESDNLPDDYRGNLIVTSWGDHRIDRFRLKERGASFRSTAEAMISGGENFRPVGIALAPDGSLFISDWVDKSYEVHGKGRIWHLRASLPKPRQFPIADREALTHADRAIREEAARRSMDGGESGRETLRQVLKASSDPRARYLAFLALSESSRTKGSSINPLLTSLLDSSPEVRTLAGRALPAKNFDPSAMAANDPSPFVRAAALRRLDGTKNALLLLSVLEESDPFILQAAREALRATLTVNEALALSKVISPGRRLEILLILRDSTDPRAREALPRFLADPDPTIRFAAIQWVGEQHLNEYRTRIAEGLSSGSVTRPIFEATLASLELLDGGRRPLRQEFSGEEYVSSLVRDERTSPALRRRALRSLRPDHPDLTLGRLARLLDSNDPALAIEATRSLREGPLRGRIPLLMDLAARRSVDAMLRAEAIVGLSGDDPLQRDRLVEIATDSDAAPSLRREAIRSLQGSALSKDQRARITERNRSDAASGALVERVLGSGPATARGAQDLDGWLKDLAGPGDAAEGERIFYHPKGPACYRCHAVDGRGGTIGPDLSTTSKTLTRPRLIESILRPTKEVAPQFVPWTIARKDGTVLSGILLREGPDGEQTFANNKGETFTLKASEIDERRPLAGSIMPDDLPRSMTIQEFRDLLAFLRQPE